MGIPLLKPHHHLCLPELLACRAFPLTCCQGCGHTGGNGSQKAALAPSHDLGTGKCPIWGGEAPEPVPAILSGTRATSLPSEGTPGKASPGQGHGKPPDRPVCVSLCMCICTSVCVCVCICVCTSQVYQAPEGRVPQTLLYKRHAEIDTQNTRINHPRGPLPSHSLTCT